MKKTFTVKMNNKKIPYVFILRVQRNTVLAFLAMNTTASTKQICNCNNFTAALVIMMYIILHIITQH